MPRKKKAAPAKAEPAPPEEVTAAEAPEDAPAAPAAPPIPTVEMEQLVKYRDKVSGELHDARVSGLHAGGVVDLAVFGTGQRSHVTSRERIEHGTGKGQWSLP